MFGSGKRKAGPSAPLLLSLALLAGAAVSLGWSLQREPLPRLALPATYAADPAVQLAAATLDAALVASFPSALPWTALLPQDPPLQVVVGAPHSPQVVQLTHRAGIAILPRSDEEYSIYPLPGLSPPRVIVVGGGPLGIAYGLEQLAQDLQLRRPYLQYPIPIHRSPAMQVRLVADPLDPRYPGPDQALEWGYNAVLTEPWPTLVLFDRYDPAIYNPARFAKERAWVEARRELAGQQIHRAKRLHLKVFAPGDVISLPDQVAALYGKAVTNGNAPARYCIELPKVQAVLAAALDELFTTFPEVDGVMVRTGENYAIEHISGNTPQAAQCGADGQDSVARMLRFMYQQVVVRHGKQLIQRTWDLGGDGAHAQPGISRRLAAAVPAQPPPVFSIKITETDFWRYNRLNPTLTEITLPRMVEFQAAREYEGKGAFPNYVGAIYAQGLPELGENGGIQQAYRAGVRQAWIWAKGGGWDGPTLQSDIWVDANVYALSRLLWEPDADPAVLARDWAALRFGAAASPYVANLLMRSSEASLKAFYVRCYALKHGAWIPNLLWVRDDVVSGGPRMEALYHSCSSDAEISQALQEKREAVALVDEMIEDYHRAEPHITDHKLAETVLVSLLYQRSLFESFQHYFEGMFNYYRYRDSGKRNAAARHNALAAFQALDDAWATHTTIIPMLPGAATPFRSAGMDEAIAHARRDLGVP